MNTVCQSVDSLLAHRGTMNNFLLFILINHTRSVQKMFRGWPFGSAAAHGLKFSLHKGNIISGATPFFKVELYPEVYCLHVHFLIYTLLKRLVSSWAALLWGGSHRLLIVPKQKDLNKNTSGGVASIQQELCNQADASARAAESLRVLCKGDIYFSCFGRV